MNRKVCQLSENIQNLLRKQAAHELRNFNLYNSFANYFSLEGLVDLQEYYLKRAKEEKLHHTWILEYMNDSDSRLTYEAIEINPEQEVENILQPFTATVDREILTTNMIYNIYNVAMEEKDFMTSAWLLSKLIPEQIEEESTSRMAVTIMESDGDVFLKADKILELLG